MYEEFDTRIWNSEYTAYVSTSKLEQALRKASKQATQYEQQMKDLEGKLSESLSNFRAIDSQLQEAFVGIRRNTRRATRAMNSQVPHIAQELDESMKDLVELAETLPVIRTRVHDIKAVYDSGRKKAQALVQDLTWLNTEFYERWRAIVFTARSPVSWRWKVIMRTLFVVSFVMCIWLVWIALAGTYRAYRQRLLWGERLMS
ncbi:hypothetical protein FISHEDRAFT_57872 [Fistulina hepatica ATCC 64428]|uniref:Uncharacterized protein n=1 Tax=Fistulina hepatica ATCC 64428 TaxID=1128425 RepID=A0A0D7AFU2_9AGAR|nr:hypothetical protein FISHEDRAFT_57872 [Fistulina hepatica ATCC 64428]